MSGPAPSTPPQPREAARRVIRAIEDSFPIVEINRLAVPERNAFKPIYQMHKWFARRASCVFRAILLGCLKPLPLDENGKPTMTGAALIMDEFYKDHTHDPDTKGKVVLDPFMGGGTTVVEALRLGCRVIGIDLNPVAWFIVKTEIEPVDLDALKAAFERLAARPVAWSGKPLRETLLELYKTACPCCGAGRQDADIIYTFWVKSAICTACKKLVPLFKDYLIARKSPSIRYWRDAECPRCHKTFDWETEPAALVAEAALRVNSPAYGAGAGRSTARWACSAGKTVTCPWCSEDVTARPAKTKRERKKVPLAVLLCPFCDVVWQYRGDLPDSVSCPVCRRDYNPGVGNVPRKGGFLCSCGHTDDIIRSIRRLPEDQLLPIQPYAIEGYCPRCGGDGEAETAEEERQEALFGEKLRSKKRARPDHACPIARNGGKFFTSVTPADLRRIEEATAIWEREKERLPYPKQQIPDGQETHRLLEHHYRYWHQMFHPRQLLCLAALMQALSAEEDPRTKELLLSPLTFALDWMNTFTRFEVDRTHRFPMHSLFSRHAFQPKATFFEANYWGSGGSDNFYNWKKVLSAKAFCERPYDYEFIDDKRVNTITGETVAAGRGLVTLISGDSRFLPPDGARADLFVTDPPYAGNVNYAELSDFFYVWLREALAAFYPWFAPEHVPKDPEIVENRTRGKTSEDFEAGLQSVFAECHKVSATDIPLVFTFHHKEGPAWEALLRAVCDAGFEIAAVYPVQGEAENSLHLLGNEGISYDLIHVCRKRDAGATSRKRSWAGIREEIRRRAREEIAAIEAGRYGKEPLNPSDVNIILIGKCMELYSRHYGAIFDHEDREVLLHDALKQIRDIADQMVEREQPLPSELTDIDPESRIYLRALCGVREVKADDVHKATRGVLEPADLIEAGLMTRMRAGRGRSYEVKSPSERLSELLERFHDTTEASQPNLFGQAPQPEGQRRVLFIDRVHLLLGLAEARENIVPWLDRFRGETPQIRASLEFIEGRSKAMAPQCRKVLGLLDVGPLFEAHG